MKIKSCVHNWRYAVVLFTFYRVKAAPNTGACYLFIFIFFAFLFEKLFKWLFDYHNSCWLIFCRSANRLIVAALVDSEHNLLEGRSVSEWLIRLLNIEFFRELLSNFLLLELKLGTSMANKTQHKDREKALLLYSCIPSVHEVLSAFQRFQSAKNITLTRNKKKFCSTLCLFIFSSMSLFIYGINKCGNKTKNKSEHLYWS